jgi:hypothetical protein
MDQCTHKVRAEHWKGIIEACSKSSDDQSVKSWLDEKGICEQSYYWQRKLRRQAYELMQENQTSAPEVSTGTNVSFVEVPETLGGLPERIRRMKRKRKRLRVKKC